MKPYVGQLFSSFSETYKYYYWYASITEFSVRLGFTKSKFDKNKSTNILVMKILLC